MNIKQLTSKKRLTRSLMVAVPLAATGLVVAGFGSSVSVASSTGNLNKHAPVVVAPSKASKTAGVTKCDGGPVVKQWNRGYDSWVESQGGGNSAIMPGSIMRIKGPASGKAAFSVNLSSSLSYLTPGSDGFAKVILDGHPMQPADAEVYQDGGVYYGQYAQNYCREIGPGFHNFKVVLSDDASTTGYYFELFAPMFHAELSQ